MVCEIVDSIEKKKCAFSYRSVSHCTVFKLSKIIYKVSKNKPSLCFVAPRKCPFPKELKNGQLYFRGQQPSHQMFDITCDRGYYLHGPSLRTCQPDGKWSGDDPICKGEF